MNWFDATGKPLDSVAIDSRALHYADGFFTTMRVFLGKCQLLNYHIARLERCASVLSLGLNVDNVTTMLNRHAKRLQFGVIKVHVSRTSDGARGYLGVSHTALVLYGCQQDLADNQNQLPIQSPILAGVLQMQLSLQPAYLVGLKTCARLEQVLLARKLHALNEKSHSRLGEALVCSLDDKLCEGIASNFFYKIDGVWHTPTLAQAGVHGTFRAALLDCGYDFEAGAKNKNSGAQLAELSIAELGNMEAAFFTNAVKGIMPVAGFVEGATLQAGLTRVGQENASFPSGLDVSAVAGVYERLHDNAAFMAHF